MSNSRRDKQKFPNLNKEYNLCSRGDYIEADYVDGVYDQHGKCVIRPLNDEEKAWLDKFYAETVVAEFNHSKKGKQIARDIQKLKKKPRKNKEQIAKLKNQIVKIQKKENLITDKEKQLEIYSENNSRNRCIFNKLKHMEKLDNFDESSYDKVHATYDVFYNRYLDNVHRELDKKLEMEKKQNEKTK